VLVMRWRVKSNMIRVLPSKLSRAYHMWQHTSQNDVNETTLEKMEQIKLVAS